MRLFIAFEIPPAVRAEIATAVSADNRRLPSARWVRQDRIHLTLLFIGATAEEVLPAVRDSVAEVLGSEPRTSLQIRGAGVFPAGRPSRVLWLGVEEGSPGALGGMHRRMADALEPIGYRPEKRPFRPHLTIAYCRPRPWAEASVRRFRASFDRTWGEPFTVSEAVLFESRLLSDGPEYRPLASFPLGKAA